MRFGKSKPAKTSAQTSSSGSVGQASSRRSRLRALRIWVLLLLAFLLAGWALVPVPRVVGLIANPGYRGIPAIPGNLPVQEVHFQATDSVHLAGWLIVASAHAPTVILVHGSRGARTDMLLWAHFLFAAG